VAEALAGHLSRVAEAFGVETEARPQAVAAPADLGTAFRGFLDAYLSVWAALSGDDAEGAAAAVDALPSAWAELDASGLPNEAHERWDERSEQVAELCRTIAETDDISAIRTAFAPLSTAIASVIREYGLTGEGPLYYMHCPMAFDNTGAYWLQADRDLLNPYYGAEMLYCGLIVEEWAGAGEDRDPGERVHE
jgi:Cu(I)/Ag(I) efflux system membrane fusion protein